MSLHQGRCLKLEGVFLRVTLTANFSWESDGMLTPLHFLHTLDQDLDLSVNSLGSNVCSHPIRLLDFGVYLVLDTTSYGI
jgi:hypothetical protein